MTSVLGEFTVYPGRSNVHAPKKKNMIEAVRTLEGAKISFQGDLIVLEMGHNLTLLTSKLTLSTLVTLVNKQKLLEF